MPGKQAAAAADATYNIAPSILHIFPAAAAKVPPAHEVHLDAPAAEYDPARQPSQLAALALAEKKPAAQAPQAEAPAAL